MPTRRKWTAVIVACAIATGTACSLTIGSPAWAKVTRHAVVKGTVTCSGTQGTITFKPPLTPLGTAKEKKVTVKVASFGSCQDQNANPVLVKKALVKVKLGHGATSSCANFATGTSSDSITLKVAYRTKGVGATNIKFGAGSITAITSGNVGFEASGGTAKGSYAGAANFTVTLASISGSEIASCVGGSGTVASLQIDGGSASY